MVATGRRPRPRPAAVRRADARADARPLPGRRRRSSSATGSASPGSATATAPRRSCSADVVDRPLAPLEGPDPVPRPALPRRDLRRPGQRPLGPPARSGRVCGHASSPPTLSRSSTRPGRARRCSPGCRWARPRSASPAEHPERVLGLVLHRPVGRRSRDRRPPRTTPTFEDRRPTTRAGPSTTSTTGGATGRASPSGSSAKRFTEPHSTKQIEDGVGWILETDPETLIDGARPTAAADGWTPDDWLAGDVVRRVRCPGARHPRHATTTSPVRHGRAWPTAIRGAPRAGRRRRPRPDRPRPGPRQPAHPRLRRGLAVGP